MTILTFPHRRLPQPVQVLKKLGLPLRNANRQGYWVLPCPFHKDGNEKNPSLNVHATDGHYRCHACGAKGRDIVSFYMRKTGKNWIHALNDLRVEEKSL
jgi:DNA primase